VDGVLAAFQPMDVEGATLEIDVEPPQARRFGDAQAMAVHHQHEEPVALGIGGAVNRPPTVTPPNSALGMLM